MAKVGDAHIDVHADTKKAEEELKNVDKAIHRMNNRMSRFGDTMLHADRISASFSRRLSAGFTTGLKASLDRGENGLIAFGNALQVAGSGFKKTQNESVLALRSFQSFQRRTYSLQAALGVLAGSVGDVAGSVLSLVGVLSQAAFSLAGVVGALASMIAGFAVAKIAMGGVGKALGQLWNGQNTYNKALRDTKKELKELRFELEGAVLGEKEAAIELEKARTQLAMAQDLPPDNMVRREAELAYQRADLNYRRAKAKVNDLQDTIKRGGDAAARAANADPFKGLTKSQISFTKYLLTLKPQMQALKEAAASSFLPPLQTAIGTLVSTTFPTLMDGFKLLGSAMGYAANEFANVFRSSENIELLRQFFVSSEPSIKKMGESSGRFLAGFLGMLKAAQPLTDRFLEAVDTLSIKFETISKSTQFSEFLRSAGYIAGEISRVFSYFSDGIGNIMAANFPPGGGGAGQVLLDWLKGIGQGFASFTGSNGFASWLKSATENSTVLVGVIGDFLHIFLDLAARPEIKQFWTTLQTAIPDITKMLLDGIKAGPAFAGMIASIVHLFSLLSDTGALQTFFGTLKIIVDILNKIITPLVPFLNFIGQIHGAFLAIGLAVIVFQGAGMIFAGLIGLIVQKLGGFLTILMEGTRGAARYATALAQAERPMTSWSRKLIEFIRGQGNANRVMNRNANDFYRLGESEKAYNALKAAQPGLVAKATGALVRHTDAIKAAFAGRKALTNSEKAGNAVDKAGVTGDRQKVSALRLIGQAFKDTKASLTAYTQAVRERRRQEILANQTAKEALATIKATDAALKSGRLVNRMGGRGAGAGVKGFSGGMGLMGAGFAAEGLISGAATGGMTAGSALTTLGGAAMFIPGGQLIGLGVSITGSILQGFEAAARAEKEKQEQINAERIQMQVENAEITANKLNEKKDEFASLLGQKGMTYEKAVAILNTRNASVTGAASIAGLEQGSQAAGALDQFRRLLLDQGITEKSAGYSSLLTAGAGLAKTLSKYGDVDPQALLGPIMSTFRGEGAAALSKYGRGGATAPILQFVPGSNDTQVRLATEGQTGLESQIIRQTQNLPNIAKNIGVLDQFANVIKTNKTAQLSTDSVFGSVGKTRTDMSMTGAITNVDKTAAFKYLGDALKTGVFDSWIKANPALAAQASPSYASKVLGTSTNPLSVKPDPAQIDALQLQANNAARTAAAMDLLKGAIVDGKLRVEDINKNDNIAPVLIAPPTASKEYKDWVQTANAQLSAAFYRG